MREDTLALTVSGRVYRMLLFTYPAPFRSEYGAEMAQVFRDECRHVAGRNGLFGLFILWLLLIPDLVRSAFAEHIWEAFHMSLAKFFRGSGLAAILAGILWVSLFVVATELLAWDAFSNVITAMLFVLIMALFAFGLAGVRRRYPGLLYVRLSFAIAYLSIVWLIVGGLITLFTETGWMVFISGFYLFAFGLLSVGLSGLAAKAFAPWGLLMPLIALCLIGFIVTGDDPTPPIQMLLGTAYGLGWVVLGYVLWRSDTITPDSALPA